MHLFFIVSFLVDMKFSGVIRGWRRVRQRLQPAAWGLRLPHDCSSFPAVVAETWPSPMLSDAG
jgi:hypothetical protein